MSRTTANPTRPPAARAATSAVRIRFEADAAAPLRRYVDPRPAVAVTEPADGSAPPPPSWPEPTDDLLVLLCPDPRSTPAVDPWLTGPDHPDAPRPVRVPVDGGRLTWWPGRAVLAGPVDGRDDVIAAVADFAFYEGELRRLESALPALERTAAEDVRLAYRIADRDAAEWARLDRTMEQLAALRLTFARLGPRLGSPPRSLPAVGRRAFRRLAERAGVEDRLTAVSDRMEACEDLYEGAVDRITDHRWWRKGHLLESVIVVLLGVEGLQLAVELALRLWQARGR